MESSNSPDLAPNATTETASPVENSAPQNDNASNLMPSETTKQQSLKDVILARKGKEETSETPSAPSEKAPEAPKPGEPAAPVAAAPEAPKYEPNYKFKAFGKEKEIPELFRGVIKDAESEKQVREVFTRAEAFDDMKGRYEQASLQNQQVLNNFSALDRDVRRVTGFLNKGDLDNFFSSVKLSDAQLLKYLQTKAQYMQDPQLAAQYQQQVDQRAQLLQSQEQYESLQQNYSTQAVQTRTMQLDHVLSRPDILGTASAWDQKMGEGAFRNLVIQEAANYYLQTKQDLPADAAVQLALQRYGKLVAPSAPQAPGPTPAPTLNAEVPSPQAPSAPVAPGQKPVIPSMNGKGTSPVKQVPKSLADLKRMGKEIAAAEASANNNY